ncbi:type II secretion system F family protein [Bacillus sp. FJAT-29814]|uniref:type II secretion system F family protein n=1 Tax=Bacillus sp. FJAT-29814 TaxID=1729688 RepID=UPI0008370C4F|nr:type II secretion system F family protein [Bacillus sp. FJAT-29814]
MLGYYIYLAVIVVVLLILYLLSFRRYREFVQEYKADFKLTALAPMSLLLIDRLKLMHRFPNVLSDIHLKIRQLYDERRGTEFTKMHLAECISMFLVIVLFSAIFGVAADGNLGMVIFGVVFAVLIPIVLTQKLTDRVKERQEDIILELPEFVNKLVLLVNAGMNVEKAIVRAVSQKKDAEKNYLYRELKQVVAEINNNGNFAAAIEQFNKRCRIQEVSVFASTLLLNYNRGSELVIALRGLSRELWEKRKAVAKIRGEQASTKLVFPMVIIFIVILVMIGYPAMALM